MLYLQHQLTNNHGLTVSHHQISKVELSPDADALVLTVHSWASEIARQDGYEPSARGSVRVPLVNLGSSASLVQDLGYYLTTAGGFEGGQVVPTGDGTLSNAKIRKWAEMKAAREAATGQPLVTPYGTFDADPASRSNISGAVQMLQALAAAGNPTTVDFTLADNSVVTLNTLQMTEVGLLLGAQVQTAHATARLRRTAIEAAATREEVEAVTW